MKTKQNVDTTHEISALKSELVINPNNIDTLFELAKFMDAKQDYKQAEYYLQQIDQILPSDPNIQFYLGRANLLQNKFYDAIVWLSQAISSNPFICKPYISISQAFKAVNDEKKAIINLEKALTITDNPEEQLECYRELGMIHLNQKQPLSAISCFSKALTINPNDEFLILNLSTSYVMNKDLIKADEIISIFPENSPFEYLQVLHKSEILKLANNSQAAIELLSKYIAEEPAHAAFLSCKLGELWQHNENYDQAEQCYKFALSNNIHQDAILKNLVSIANIKQDYAAARNYIEQLLQLAPNSTEIQIMLALSYINEQNFDEAVKILNKIIENDPAEANPYLLKAEIYLNKYFETGNTMPELETEAINAYLKALELFPNDPAITSRITSVKRMQSNMFELKIIEASLQRLFNEYDNLVNKEIDPLNFTKEEGLALANYCSLCASTFSWNKLNYSKPILTKIVIDQLLAKQECCVPAFISHHIFPDKVMQHKLSIEYAKHFKSTQPYTAYPDHDTHKLRIGYVSPDFNANIVGFLIDDMFKHHDRNRFEIFAYSLRERLDDQRTKIISSVDHFTEISNISTKNICNMIHSDKIDILIDLTG